MPLWKTFRLHGGFSGDWALLSLGAEASLFTGRGQLPAPTAQRANADRMRTTTDERLIAIMMFIRKAGFEADCRNWNSGGKPFFARNITFFGDMRTEAWSRRRKTTLGNPCRAT